MDKFDVHAWKLSQLLSEGRGRDLANEFIAKMREAFRTLDDDELQEFREQLALAFDMDLKENQIDLSEEQIEQIFEEDDRCTRIAKRKYDVWPSAYASGAVVRCRKGEIWKNEK